MLPPLAQLCVQERSCSEAPSNGLCVSCVRHVHSLPHLFALACMHHKARSYTNNHISAGPCHCFCNVREQICVKEAFLK